jgi:hypothetical protein
MNNLVFVMLIIIILIIYLYHKKVENYFNYIDDLKLNDNTFKLFCKKLNNLNTPNESNALIKKFKQNEINTNNKSIKRLEDKIKIIQRNRIDEEVYKKNMYKYVTHSNANKQLEAINNFKKNINSTNKVNLNIK